MARGAGPRVPGAKRRGVLVDLVERRVRFYACQSAILRPGVGWIESMELAFAEAAVWKGWDVAYA